MKLPFRKNKEFHSVLYDLLGFYPHDIELYRTAFSHKSLAYRPEKSAPAEGKERRRGGRNQHRAQKERPQKPINNERLEYLGDAVLEAVVSDILFRHFSNKREGFLTATRSKIVQRDTLNHLSEEMGLEKLIQAAEGTRMSHTNIGGNAFEALIGAIYLDRGYKFCHWFVANRMIGRYIELEKIAQKEVNFKSKLLEWSQKNRINLRFDDKVLGDGQKGFLTVIIIEGITIARGEGRAKKDSQQEAAKEALRRMRNEPKTYDSLFRAKEKRTAMEAEESFALPRIEELDLPAGKGKREGRKGKEDAPPVLEGKDRKPAASASDAAYDAAYDEDADYEVIDQAPEQPQRTEADYEALGIPAPPIEDEIKAAEEKLRKKRQRGRGAKTVGDAVKSVDKGTSTPEEKAARRQAEHQANVEKATARAERKAKAEARRKAKEEAAPADEVAAATSEETVSQTKESVSKTEKPDELTDKQVAEAEASVAEAETSVAQEEVSVAVTEEPTHVTEISLLTTEEQTAAIAEAAPATAEAASDIPSGETLEEESFLVRQDLTPISFPCPIEEEPAFAKDEASFEKDENTFADNETTFTESEASFAEDEATFAENETSFAEEEKAEAAEPAAAYEREVYSAPIPSAEADGLEPEEENDEWEDTAADQADAEPSAAAESEIRPHLRHLTMDDFVFGMDDGEETPLADEEAEDAVTAKPKRSRRRRRKPQGPKADGQTGTQGGQATQQAAPSSAPASDTPDQGEAGQAKKRHRLRRRRPSRPHNNPSEE